MGCFTTRPTGELGPKDISAKMKANMGVKTITVRVRKFVISMALNPTATYESMSIRTAASINPIYSIFAETVVKGFSTSNLVSEDSFNLGKVAETTYLPKRAFEHTTITIDPVLFSNIEKLNIILH